MLVKIHSYLRVMKFISLMWTASIIILSCTANNNSDSNDPPVAYNYTFGEFHHSSEETALTANAAIILRLIAPVGDIGVIVTPLNRTLKASRLWTSICFYNLVMLLKQFPSWFNPTNAYKLILRFMHHCLLTPMTPSPLQSVNENEALEEIENVIVMMSEHAQTLRVMGVALWSVYQQVIHDGNSMRFLQDVSVSVMPVQQQSNQVSAMNSRAASPSISRTAAVVGSGNTTPATAAANNTIKITVMDILHSIDALVQNAISNDSIHDSSVLERLLLSIHLRTSFKLSQALSNGFLVPPTTLPNRPLPVFLYDEDDIEDLRYNRHEEQSVEYQLQQQLIEGGLFNLRHIFQSNEFTSSANAQQLPPRQQLQQDLGEVKQWMSRWESFYWILSSPQAVSWLEIYNDHQLTDACQSMAVHWQLLLMHRTHTLFHVILQESITNHQRQFVTEDGFGSLHHQQSTLTQWYQSTQLESLATLPTDPDQVVVQQVVLNSSSPLAIDLVKEFITVVIRFMSKSLPLIHHLLTLEHNTAAESLLTLQEHVLASYWWLLHRTTGFAIDFQHTEELLTSCNPAFQTMPETTLGAIFALTLQHAAISTKGKSVNLLKEAVHRCINSMTEQAVLPSMFEKIAAVIATTHTQPLTDHDALPFVLQAVDVTAPQSAVIAGDTTVNGNVFDFLAHFIKLAVKRLSLMVAPTASEQMSVDVMQSMTSGLCDMMHCVLLFMLQPCQLLLLQSSLGECHHVLRALFDQQYVSESLDGLWQLWIRLDDIYQVLLLHHSSSSDGDIDDINAHRAMCFPITSSVHHIAIHLYVVNASIEQNQSFMRELHAQLLLWLRLLEMVKQFLAVRPAAYLALKLKDFLLRCLKARFLTFLCLIDESDVDEYFELVLTIINDIYETKISPEQAQVVQPDLDFGAVVPDLQLQSLTCVRLIEMLSTLFSNNHEEQAKRFAGAINKKFLNSRSLGDQNDMRTFLTCTAQSLLKVLPQRSSILLRFEDGWELYLKLITTISAPAFLAARQQQHVVDLTVSNHNSPSRHEFAASSRGPQASRGVAANEEEPVSFDFYAVPDTTGPISGNTKDGDETYASMMSAVHHEKETVDTENVSSASVFATHPPSSQQQQQQEDSEMNVDHDNNHQLDRQIDSQNEAAGQQLQRQQGQEQIESQADHQQPSMPSPIMAGSQQTRHSLSSGKRTRPSPLLSTTHGPPETTTRKRRRLVGSEYEAIEELIGTISNKLQQSRQGGIADEDGKEALLFEALQESHTLSSVILDLINQQRTYPQHMQKMADEDEENET